MEKGDRGHKEYFIFQGQVRSYEVSTTPNLVLMDFQDEPRKNPQIGTTKFRRLSD